MIISDVDIVRNINFLILKYPGRKIIEVRKGSKRSIEFVHSWKLIPGKKSFNALYGHFSTTEMAVRENVCECDLSATKLFWKRNRKSDFPQ